MTEYQVTLTDASVAIDAESLDDPLSLLDDDVSFDIELTEDGQWEATDIEWPSPDADVEVPLAEFDIDIAVTGPVRGTLDHGTGEMTVSLSLELAIEVSIAIASVDGTVTLDTTPTTGTSGDLTGRPVDSTVDATLVDNEFEIRSAGDEKIDTVFGLPASEGRNWFELGVRVEESSKLA